VPSDAYYTAAEELAKNGTISSATMAAVKDPKESGYLRAQENIYKRGSALDSAAARAAATATANKALTAAAKTQDAPAEVYAAADAGAQKAYDAAGDKVKTKGRAAAVTDAIAYYTTHKTLSPELVNRLTGFDGGMDAFDKARGELEAGDKFKNDQATADAAAAAAKRLADKDTQDKLGPVRKLTLQEQTDIATTASGIIDNAQTDLFPGVNEQAKISLKHTIALAAQDLVAYSDRGDMSPEEATDFAYRYITQPTQFTVKKPGANDPDPDHTILTDKLNDLSIRVPNSTAKALGRAMFLATPPKTVSPPDERPTGPARTSPPPAEPFVAPQPNYLPGAGGEMFPTPPGRTIRPEPFAGPTRP
jgi:hypothetical protein